jgi:lysophospholipase L1-like esterase
MHIRKSIAMCLLASSAVYSQTAPLDAAAGDFANLARYRDADSTLGQGKGRVVFLGDSITDYWGKRGGQWFPSPDWLNRGIGGQTTSQLLLRTRQDAIALHPRALIIQGGSNDMRLGFSAEAIRDNIASIADIARANHIRVLIAAMTPVCDCVRPLTGERTVAHIRRLNDLLRELCKQHNYEFLDYYTPLADEAGRMRQEFTTDGVHLNDQGYSRIAPVVIQSLNLRARSGVQ